MRRLLAIVLAGALGYLAFVAPTPVEAEHAEGPVLQYPAFSTESAFCPTWQSDNAVSSRIVAVGTDDFTGRWFFDGSELSAFAGSGDVKRSWSADPGLAQGFTPVHLFSPEGVVSGGVRSTGSGFDASAVCTRMGADDWAVGIGSSLEGHTSTLLLYNPFPQAAIAEIEVYSEQGLEVSSTLESIVIPPRTLREFPLEAELRLREYLFVVVHEEKGRIIPSLERVSPEGGRGLAVGSALSPRWFFPVGGPIGSTVQLMVVNPSVATLSVEVDFFGIQDSELGAHQIVMPGRSAQVFQVPAEHAAAINSDGPIAASLLVESPKGVGITQGTQSVAQTWVLPGLTRGPGLQLAWVLNPGAAQLTVSYEVYGAGGASAPIEVVVDPGRVRLVLVGATNSDAVVLTGDQPFVAGWTSEAPDDFVGLVVETGVPYSG
jgi:hypothetical protein